MLRAVIFDFFSVFREDIYQEFLDSAAGISDDVKSQVETALNNYYQGITSMKSLRSDLEIIYRTHDIPTEELLIEKLNIPDEFVNITKKLHMHFLKVILAGNFGEQEKKLLETFNNETKQFDSIITPANYGELLTSNKFFEGMLNEIGEPPQNCILISGHEDYINFASSIGMVTYLYTDYRSFFKEIHSVFNLD